jgi:hypothetical protein
MPCLISSARCARRPRCLSCAGPWANTAPAGAAGLPQLQGRPFSPVVAAAAPIPTRRPRHAAPRARKQLAIARGRRRAGRAPAKTAACEPLAAADITSAVLPRLFWPCCATLLWLCRHRPVTCSQQQHLDVCRWRACWGRLGPAAGTAVQDTHVPAHICICATHSAWLHAACATEAHWLVLLADDPSNAVGAKKNCAGKCR